MSRAKGNKSEDIVCEILAGLGHSIIGRNYTTRYGELDIITQKGEKFHIIEVKSSYGLYGSAQNFNKIKLNRVSKTARIWAMIHDIHESQIQIDLVVLNVTTRSYQYIKNANLYFH